VVIDVPQLVCGAAVVQFACCRLVATWHVGDVYVSDHIMMVAYEFDDVTFLDLRVIDVHQDADPRAADLFE
jgi:hypothetical protein